MLILKKIYEIIKRKNNFSFSILDEVVEKSSQHTKFLIGFDGKCLRPVEKQAMDLLISARDKSIFSEEDYNRILSAVIDNQRKNTERKYKAKYFLINHRFSEQMEDPLVLYMDDKNELYIKLAKEVYSNVDELRKFSSEDSACIGSIVGYHEAEQELKIRNTIKSSNVINLDRRLYSV